MTGPWTFYQEPGPGDRVRFQTNGPLALVSIAEIRKAQQTLVSYNLARVTLARNTVDETDLTALLKSAQEQVRARAKAGGS